MYMLILLISTIAHFFPLCDVIRSGDSISKEQRFQEEQRSKMLRSTKNANKIPVSPHILTPTKQNRASMPFWNPQLADNIASMICREEDTRDVGEGWVGTLEGFKLQQRERRKTMAGTSPSSPANTCSSSNSNGTGNYGHYDNNNGQRRLVPTPPTGHRRLSSILTPGHEVVTGFYFEGGSTTTSSVTSSPHHSNATLQHHPINSNHDNNEDVGEYEDHDSNDYHECEEEPHAHESVVYHSTVALNAVPFASHGSRRRQSKLDENSMSKESVEAHEENVQELTIDEEDDRDNDDNDEDKDKLEEYEIEKKSSVNTGQGKLIEPGALYIRKIICSDLAPMEIMTVVGDSNDPYVKLRYGASGRVQSTNVINNAGNHASYDNLNMHFHEEVLEEDLRSNSKCLHVSVYDNNSILADTLIGECEVPLDRLLEAVGREQKLEAIEIFNNKNKSTGLITIWITLVSSSVLHQSQSQIESSSSNFFQSKDTDCNDPGVEVNYYDDAVVDKDRNGLPNDDDFTYADVYKQYEENVNEENTVQDRKGLQRLFPSVPVPSSVEYDENGGLNGWPHEQDVDEFADDTEHYDDNDNDIVLNSNGVDDVVSSSFERAVGEMMISNTATSGYQY